MSAIQSGSQPSTGHITKKSPTIKQQTSITIFFRRALLCLLASSSSFTPAVTACRSSATHASMRSMCSP